MALGTSSQAKLNTCDSRLVRVFSMIAEEHSFRVIWGARSQTEEDQAVASGASRIKPGKVSKHQLRPSEALDIDLPPYNYKALTEAYVRFAEGVVLPIARELGVSLRWGGAWSGRRNTAEYLEAGGLDDVGHFEIASRPGFNWEVAA